MNLRHIDPRSIDWMDAMLEGELEGKVEGRTKRERGGEKDENDLHPIVASQVMPPESLASRPPPGQR